MHSLPIRNRWKSSALVALLFLCSAFTRAGVVCPSDTIIVDGRTVVVEREVRFENEGDRHEDDKPKKSILRKYIGGMHAGFGAAISDQTSGMNGLQTLDQFTGKQRGANFQFDAGFLFGYESRDKWLLEAGLALGYSSVRNRYFVGSALGDSLVAFDSPETGVLRQIQHHQLEIGEEWYNDPVEMRKGSYSQLTLDLPIRLMHLFDASRGSKVRWMLGAGIRVRYVLSPTSSNWVLLNQEGGYAFIDVDEIAPNTLQLDAGLAGGMRLILNNRTHVSFRAYVNAPLVGPTAPDGPLQINWFHTGFAVGVNKVFRHDQGRRTTK